MSTAYLGWLFFRSLRWLLTLSAIVYYAEFIWHRPAHLNQFGHLLPTTEFWIFGLPMAAIFAGFLELMMRERTGRQRPAFGRDWRPLR